MFELCSLFTEFCNCADSYSYQNSSYLCCKKTVLSLETSSEINFEFIKFVKNKKCHKHVTNAPKGIGLAQDTFEER